MSGMATATVVAGGLSYMSGKSSGKAAKSASKKQLAMQREAMAENKRQYEAIVSMLSPYNVAGTGALAEQQAILGLKGPDVQRGALATIEQSPYFQAVAQQGENAMLQNVAATGGLRGGNIQGALAQFRPQLLNQLIQERYSNLGGLVNVGQNAMSQQVSARAGQGAQNVNLLQQQGAAQAGGILGQAAGQAQGMAGIGSMIGSLAGMFGRSPQNVSSPAASMGYSTTGYAGAQGI